MKSFIASLALVAASASLAAAQSTPPACVTTCYIGSVGSATGCSTTTLDISCLCKNTPFQAAVGQCLTTSCTSAADIQAGLQYGYNQCIALGITVATSLPGGASTAASGAAQSTAASSAASAATSVASAAASNAESKASSVASSASGAVASLSSAAAKVTSAAAAATSKAASGAGHVQVGGLLGAALMGAAALL